MFCFMSKCLSVWGKFDTTCKMLFWHRERYFHQRKQPDLPKYRNVSSRTSLSTDLLHTVSSTSRLQRAGNRSLDLSSALSRWSIVSLCEEEGGGRHLAEADRKLVGGSRPAVIITMSYRRLQRRWQRRWWWTQTVRDRVSFATGHLPGAVACCRNGAASYDNVSVVQWRRQLLQPSASRAGCFYYCWRWPTYSVSFFLSIFLFCWLVCMLWSRTILLYGLVIPFLLASPTKKSNYSAYRLRPTLTNRLSWC